MDWKLNFLSFLSLSSAFRALLFPKSVSVVVAVEVGIAFVLPAIPEPVVGVRAPFHTFPLSSPFPFMPSSYGPVPSS